MKISALTTAILSVASLQSCFAFAPSSQQRSQAKVTSLYASSKNDNMMNRRQLMSGLLTVTSAGVMSVIPAMASADDTSLDFSLPTYDPKMKGFGEGSEAASSKLERRGANADTTYTDPGADEKAKQLRSMQLAEEARLQAQAAKKAKMDAIAEYEKQKAAEKKAKNAERFASIFN